MAAAQKYWLNNLSNAAANGSYRHGHYVEAPENWDLVRDQIVEYFQRAHADARARLTALASNSLHPAGTPPPPYDQYPFGLPQVTLQGYFGEILAGYLAETVAPAGHSDWRVPAHLFRFHLQAFQFLEQRSQSGHGPSAIVGRTGDDCLAFRRNGSGEIIAVLFCEAKCTTSHAAALIRDAHEKVSASEIVDILQLVEILKDSPAPDAADWIMSLQVFHMRLHSTVRHTHQRHDLVCYVHRSVPKQNKTWIPTDRPHEAYTASRGLDVYEVRLTDVAARLLSIYSEENWR